MLRDEPCASISEQVDISGLIFIYSPKPNISQEGAVSRGSIAVRSGEHLAVKRKHTCKEAVYSTE